MIYNEERINVEKRDRVLEMAAVAEIAARVGVNHLDL